MSQRQMHLGVYAVGTGNHIAGWRYPGATTSGENIEVFKMIAASCERGKLDFISARGTSRAGYALRADDAPLSTLQHNDAHRTYWHRLYHL